MEGRRGIGPKLEHPAGNMARALGPRHLFELGRVANAEQKRPPLRDESLRGGRIDARHCGVRLGQHLLHGQ
jgi:hypothetical protein